MLRSFYSLSLMCQRAPSFLRSPPSVNWKPLLDLDLQGLLQLHLRCDHRQLYFKLHVILVHLLDQAFSFQQLLAMVEPNLNRRMWLCLRNTEDGWSGVLVLILCLRVDVAE